MPLPRRKPKRHAYNTDLSDGQWALITPLIPEAAQGVDAGTGQRRAILRAVGFCLAIRKPIPTLIQADPCSFVRDDGRLEGWTEPPTPTSGSGWRHPDGLAPAHARRVVRFPFSSGTANRRAAARRAGQSSGGLPLASIRVNTA